MQLSKRKFLILAVAIVAALAAIPGSSSAAGNAHALQSVDMLVRSFHGSYPIGRLAQGQVFDAQKNVGGWYWGYAHGYANHCGFVQKSGFDPKVAGKGSGPSCGPAPTGGGPDTLIATGLAYGPSVTGGGGHGKMKQLRMAKPSCVVHGNPTDDPGDVFRTITKGQSEPRFLRFGTPGGQITDQRRGGKFAMVMDNNYKFQKWGYVLNSCFKAWKK